MIGPKLVALFLSLSLGFGRSLCRGGIWIAGLLAGLLAASADSSENSLPANGQYSTPTLSAQATPVPNSAPGRVDVLSVLSGGMLAPKPAYHTFFIFLRDNLRSFTANGGTVRTEYVFSGPHVFRLWSHSARVKAGKAEAFSNSTRRKAARTMRALIDPFLAGNPRGRVVLGGHSYGTVEMQCLKELVEKKYGKQVVAAAYVLGPVVRKLDKGVAAMTGRHDFVVPFSDFVYPGKAVRGTTVTVPGLDHFMIQNSPDARKLLAKYFASVSSQSQDSTLQQCKPFTGGDGVFMRQGRLKHGHLRCDGVACSARPSSLATIGLAFPLNTLGCGWAALRSGAGSALTIDLSVGVWTVGNDNVAEEKKEWRESGRLEE